MTPVGDYLKKLLYQYDCLVVPELGAFLLHYRPASFTEATGLYLPPRQQLAFNEALRLDDGILINYIMLHESITRDGAMRHISQFVGAVKQQIRATGSYTLDGIGLLTTNEEGKFQFHPELRHNFFAESFGLQPLQAQYCEPTDVSLPVSVVPLTTSQALVVADSSGDETEGTLLPMPVRRPAWYWAAATLLIGSLATLSYFSVVQPNQSLQSSLSPASLLRFPTFLPTTPIEPATKLVVAMKAAAPIAAPVAKPAPLAVPAVATTPSVKAPVVVAPKPVAPVRKVVPAISPVLKPKVANVSVAVKPFLVVAGSFSSRSNALGLRKQLVKAGFNEAYLMMPTRPRDLIKVAAFGASTLPEADSAMTKISDITGVPAWLMRTRP